MQGALALCHLQLADLLPQSAQVARGIAALSALSFFFVLSQLVAAPKKTNGKRG